MHVELLVSPNATNNEAAQSLYEYCSDSRVVPDISSCQAAARRLALTLFKVRFHRSPGAQIFIYNRLLISSNSRKYFVDGTAAETANVYSLRGRNEMTETVGVTQARQPQYMKPQRTGRRNEIPSFAAVADPDQAFGQGTVK